MSKPNLCQNPAGTASPFTLLQSDSSPRAQAKPHPLICPSKLPQIPRVGDSSFLLYTLIWLGSLGPDAIFVLLCAGLHNSLLQQRGLHSPYPPTIPSPPHPPAPWGQDAILASQGMCRFSRAQREEVGDLELDNCFVELLLSLMLSLIHWILAFFSISSSCLLKSS